MGETARKRRKVGALKIDTCAQGEIEKTAAHALARVMAEKCTPLRRTHVLARPRSMKKKIEM